MMGWQLVRLDSGVGRVLWTRLFWRVQKDPPYATETCKRRMT